MKLIAFTLCLFILPLQMGWAETGKEIMQQVLDNQKVDSSAMDIEMTLIARSGAESFRRIQTLVLGTDDGSSTITVFLEPASVRNTRFLTVEHSDRGDDQWIYLPSLRKVKRIAATERDGSFMGSDFSYADMSFSDSMIEENEHAMLREETLLGTECAVVESISKVGTGATYARQLSWVDRETWIPLRVEFYREGTAAPEKVLTADNIKQIQGRWIAETITMTTTGSEHKTVLDFKQVKYDIALDPGFFTTNFLETGRTR